MKYSVVVSQFPSKINAKKLRALRLLGGMSLQDSVNLFSFASSMASVVLAAGLDRDVADYYMDVLSSAGFQVTLNESTERHPMVLAPKLANRYRWKWFHIIRSK